MPFDREVAAGDGGHADEAADLDVLGADRVRAAASRPSTPVDVEHVRADAVDLRAERDEEAAEVLDVRLAGGVRDHRLARRERRGHHGVLGAHDRRLVEVDVRAAQRAARARSAAEYSTARAELGERVDVRVEPAPADHVAARAAARWRGRGARAAGRRAGTRRGCGSRARGSTSWLTFCAWTRTSFWPVHSASAPRLASSSSIVSTSRMRGTFASDDRLLGQQARREDRQRAVLVPGGANAAGRAGGPPR